jgi:hypothetical protein
MTTRQTWDYLVEDEIGTEQLAELGAEGWELVSVAQSVRGSGNTFYFKRPAADLRERVTLDHRQRFVEGTAGPLGSEGRR